MKTKYFCFDSDISDSVYGVYSPPIWRYKEGKMQVTCGSKWVHSDLELNEMNAGMQITRDTARRIRPESFRR